MNPEHLFAIYWIATMLMVSIGCVGSFSIK